MLYKLRIRVGIQNRYLVSDRRNYSTGAAATPARTALQFGTTGIPYESAPGPVTLTAHGSDKQCQTLVLERSGKWGLVRCCLLSASYSVRSSAA